MVLFLPGWTLFWEQVHGPSLFLGGFDLLGVDDT